MIYATIPPTLERLAGRDSRDSSALWPSKSSPFDVIRQLDIPVLEVGAARYRFRTSLRATLNPRTDGNGGLLSVTPDPIRHPIRAADLDAAWKAWSDAFHGRFQALYRMRPWERVGRDAEDWHRIERIVDLAAYRRETPSRFRQIGIRQGNLPAQILWESGLAEPIDLAQAPPEFAAFAPGQRFEAVVLRDPITDRLREIVDVVPLPELPGQEECDRLWDSLPTSRDRPTKDWNQYD